jgi:hypothetical protein
MGTTTHITDDLRAFIDKQHMFFVASAPLAADGHVNLSPKGLDTFRVVDDHTVAWIDFVGSGAETMAHTRENGRLTVMFCALQGPPKILRLYGRGVVHPVGSAGCAALLPRFAPDLVGVRSVVELVVQRVSTSCGYGVPRYSYEGERRQLIDWADKKGQAGLGKYVHDKNHVSIDGLPAFDRTEDDNS